jgi:hypothetical protein
MRGFIGELYIRVLTTGMNELERLKLQDETGAATAKSSHELADWFLSLANFLSSNPIIKAECVLTAFSLHPSKHYYKCVQDCSIYFHSDSKKLETVAKKPLTTLETDLNRLDLHDESKNTVDHKTNNINNSENIPQSLVSSVVLEGEGLGLSSDLCHDLVVLLSGPRLKLLTWDSNWLEAPFNILF